MPRPTKFTPEVQERICDAVAQGATYELAAGYAGISYDTLRLWREAKPAFFAALKEAEGKAAVKWLTKIETAADEGQWQAAAWKLERRYPHDYGRKVNEVTGKDGETLTIRVLYDDEPRRALEAPASGAETSD